MTKFRMFGIHLDQFAILCEDCKDEVGMNVSLNFKYGDEGKKVACVVAFDFTSESEKVMVLKMTCEFEIQVDDWKTLHNDKEVVIPKDLLEFFAVHTDWNSERCFILQNRKHSVQLYRYPTNKCFGNGNIRFDSKIRIQR